MQHLIAANVVVPQLGADAFKVLIIVDPHGAIVLIIPDVFYYVIRMATLIPCYGRA